MHRLIALAVLAAFVDRTGGAREGAQHRADAASRRSTKAGKAWTATVSVTMRPAAEPGRTPTIRLLNNSISTAGRVVNVTTPRDRRCPASTAPASLSRAPARGASSSSTAMTGRAYPFGQTRVRAPRRRRAPSHGRRRGTTRSTRRRARRNSASPGGPSVARRADRRRRTRRSTAAARACGGESFFGKPPFGVDGEHELAVVAFELDLDQRARRTCRDTRPRRPRSRCARARALRSPRARRRAPRVRPRRRAGGS